MYLKQTLCKGTFLLFMRFTVFKKFVLLRFAIFFSKNTKWFSFKYIKVTLLHKHNILIFCRWVFGWRDMKILLGWQMWRLHRRVLLSVRRDSLKCRRVQLNKYIKVCLFLMLNKSLNFLIKLPFTEIFFNFAIIIEYNLNRREEERLRLILLKFRRILRYDWNKI